MLTNLSHYCIIGSSSREGCKIKEITLDDRSYDGVLKGVKIYYDGMPRAKAKHIGIRKALAAILSGREVTTVIIPTEEPELSPWQKKLRLWRDMFGKVAWV